MKKITSPFEKGGCKGDLKGEKMSKVSSSKHSNSSLEYLTENYCKSKIREKKERKWDRDLTVVSVKCISQNMQG